MIDHALVVALVLPPAYLAAELRRQELVARALAARRGAGGRGPGRPPHRVAGVPRRPDGVATPSAPAPRRGPWRRRRS
jgi:hypothetical protein